VHYHFASRATPLGRVAGYAMKETPARPSQPHGHGSEHPDSAKKLRERQAVDVVRRLTHSFPEGDIVLGKAGEEPDFILHSPRGVIGIEVVEYYRPDIHSKLSVKAQEKFTEKVSRIVTAECVRAGLTKVFATITFDYSERLTTTDVGPLARRVVELISPAESPEVPTLRIYFRELLPRGITEIWAHHRPYEQRPFVGVSWGGLVPPIDNEKLLEVIAGKERKLTNIYRHACSEVWLIVLVDPYNVASMAHVPPEFRLSQSRFARVIALQGWTYALDLWGGAT
jgi:hypothetical protein